MLHDGSIACLDNTVVNCAQHLLSYMLAQDQDGLRDTVMFSYRPKPFTKRFVQIVHVSNHWLTIESVLDSQNGQPICKDQIKVYDSMFYKVTQREDQKKICAALGPSKVKKNTVPVSGSTTTEKQCRLWTLRNSFCDNSVVR